MARVLAQNPRLTTEATLSGSLDREIGERLCGAVLATEPPSDDGGHVVWVASIVRSGSVCVARLRRLSELRGNNGAYLEHVLPEHADALGEFFGGHRIFVE